MSLWKLIRRKPVKPPMDTIPARADNRVIQEFYCTVSGGGCGGYILVKLNLALNGVVEVVCPNCQHKHQRHISNGEIKEQGRQSSSPTETIEPTLAAYSKEPRFKRKSLASERDSVVPKEKRDFLDERCFELYGDRV